MVDQMHVTVLNSHMNPNAHVTVLNSHMNPNAHVIVQNSHMHSPAYSIACHTTVMIFIFISSHTLFL